MKKTSNFLKDLKTVLVDEARKASAAFLVANLPTVVTLVQQNYGVAAGTAITSVLVALGVYKATNKTDASAFGPNGEPPK